MKRSVGRAVYMCGRVAVIGLAVGAAGLALVVPAGAQQQPAQQQPAQQQPAQQQQGGFPAAQPQGFSNAQPLGLRQGQDPFAPTQPQQQAAPQQQPARNPFAAQQAAPQQAVQNPFAVQPQNQAAPQQGGAGCDKLVTLLTTRREMMSKINEAAKAKQKMDAPTACSAFTKLTANGNEAIKWMSANKDWCRIPDQFIASVKNDNEKVSTIRGQACKVAAQIEQMKKNGGGQPGGGGLMGGNGLSGEMKIPSGAL
jgi:hypothetical protein